MQSFDCVERDSYTHIQIHVHTSQHNSYTHIHTYTHPSFRLTFFHDYMAGQRRERSENSKIIQIILPISMAITSSVS